MVGVFGFDAEKRADDNDPARHGTQKKAEVRNSV